MGGGGGGREKHKPENKKKTTLNKKQKQKQTKSNTCKKVPHRPELKNGFRYYSTCYFSSPFLFLFLFCFSYLFFVFHLGAPTSGGAAVEERGVVGGGPKYEVVRSCVSEQDSRRRG